MAEGKQWLNVVIFEYDGVPKPATILVLSAASPPPRPQPPPGGGGGEQPPIAGWPTVPGWPGGSLPGGEGGWGGPPVAGWPDVPGNWPSLPGKPPGGGGGGGGGGGETPPGPVFQPPQGETPGVAAVRNSTEPAPGAPPPDMPDAVYSDVFYGTSGIAKAWIGPYIQHHPGQK